MFWFFSPSSIFFVLPSFSSSFLSFPCILVNLRQATLTELKVAFWRNRSAAELQLQSETPLISEFLHQTRALRPGEVHYLDHQSLGMLVTISR